MHVVQNSLHIKNLFYIKSDHLNPNYSFLLTFEGITMECFKFLLLISVLIGAVASEVRLFYCIT